MSWAEYDLWRSKYIDIEPEPMTDMEARRHMKDCLDEYAANKRALFLDGFCDYVIKQGFGAASPMKINGKPESWQQCGRRIWGVRHFDEAMKRAIERKRGVKTSSQTSAGS